MSFENKVVIITGASSGIGAVTATSFAKQGASVVLVGRNEERLREVAKECEQYGKMLAIKADLSNLEETQNIIKQTIAKFGKLDILINNAGFLAFTKVLQEDMMEVYDKVMNTNLRGTVHLTNLAAPYLVKSKGNIVNISSIAGLSLITPEYIIYSVSKAGMDHFSKYVAAELAPHGVRVNTINPGPVRTPIFDVPDAPHDAESLGNKTALKRPSDSQEIADLILFVVGEKGKSMTGCNYVIDNGFLLK
ncbi:hypothetical protein O3G_MSEX008633 [Manduca sexta]|uniref:Ketoreductase domain-containing protein n=1 Tax=Manduca sexta TaxID=7130 RepID=A0A922CQQ2_MANSE|nr:hypothetical protein O3G_MSEX008633 [Manduca sexta]KAG6454308.1 hypothetical protein O3G_MSEX008633 [Manduca sexta]